MFRLLAGIDTTNERQSEKSAINRSYCFCCFAEETKLSNFYILVQDIKLRRCDD